jgi:8-hydroxy-5-deazaflavin:NADPH oxidoreductase
MIGGTVAALAVDAGYEVVVSNSRGPETLSGLVAELGPRARAAGREEAARAGDLVVVAIPVRACFDLPTAAFAGKVVLDTGNYYPERDGHLAELDDGSLTSSELLARELPGARVVKVFNNIFFKHLRNLARPAGAADRSALPIAGDDPAAKAAVTEFLNAIGYDAVDVGALADGWRYQPGTPAYGPPYGPFENEKGTPASADVVGAALAGAVRPA